jgi:hypothetical protein
MDDKRPHLGRATGIDGDAPDVSADAGVPRGAENIVDSGLATELPAQGMFTRPGSHHEDTHDGYPVADEQVDGMPADGPHRGDGGVAGRLAGDFRESRPQAVLA